MNNTQDELPTQPLYDVDRLLSQVAEGNTSAFRCLYERYQHKLYGYSYSLTKSRTQSEDILQEVFLKIWLNRAELSKIEYFESYLFSMVRHRILNSLKQAYTQNLANRKLSVAATEADNSTEKTVDYNLLARKVRFIVDKLPPQQKNVYLLSRDQGLKQEEIATRMGIAVTTVKKHLTLALHFIRKNLDLTILIVIWLRHPGL